MYYIVFTIQLKIYYYPEMGEHIFKPGFGVRETREPIFEKAWRMFANVREHPLNKYFYCIYI